MEEKLAPLATAMGNLFKNTEVAVSTMNRSVDRWSKMSEEALSSAKSVGYSIEKQTKMLRLKIWAIIIISGMLSAPLTVTAYSLWQNRWTEEKQKAQKWQRFEKR